MLRALVGYGMLDWIGPSFDCMEARRVSLLAQLRSRSKIAAAALLVACLGLSTNSPAKADEDRGKLVLQP